jgi:precorrin-6B methylase 2
MGRALLINNAILANESADRLATLNLLLGAWRTQVAGAMAQLGVPDYLGTQVKSSDEIAVATGTNPDAMARLLRAAVGIGLLVRRDNEFELTKVGAFLRSDVENSLRNYATLVCGPCQWIPWAFFSKAITESGSQTEMALGNNVWEYYKKHPEEKEVFKLAMEEITAMTLAEILDVVRPSKGEVLADIGGGTAYLACRLAEIYPASSFVVFDSEDSLPRAMKNITQLSNSLNVRFVIGDFLTLIGISADYYIIKNVLHNWGDNDCQRILRNCFTAARTGAKLVVIEPRLDEASECDYARLLDLNMLVLLGSRERSLGNLQKILEDTGWHVDDAKAKSGGLMNIVIASKGVS